MEYFNDDGQDSSTAGVQGGRHAQHVEDWADLLSGGASRRHLPGGSSVTFGDILARDQQRPLTGYNVVPPIWQHPSYSPPLPNDRSEYFTTPHRPAPDESWPESAATIEFHFYLDDRVQSSRTQLLDAPGPNEHWRDTLTRVHRWLARRPPGVLPDAFYPPSQPPLRRINPSEGVANSLAIPPP